MTPKIILAALAAPLALSTAAQSTTPAAPAPRTAKAATDVPACVHPALHVSATAPDSSITLTLIGRRQNYSAREAETRDEFIHSPKSANISPDNRKFYVNSLEGGTTVVYDMATKERLKVIRHNFDAQRDAALWAPESGLYKWRHYTDRDVNTFFGKPVESTFSHGGRYLWVPYYRRSFDINAQAPSAVAIIDTQTDSIIRLMETGPLPKMIRTSPDGRHVAIAHWGNNTVGIIDISSSNPADWHHERVLVVDHELQLNFPLNVSVDRDNGSGYALRGTVFTPDGSLLLVGCMGGGGGIAVIDMKTGKYLGRVVGMLDNVRHLLIHGPWLYLSINRAGKVQRIALDEFVKAARMMNGTTVKTARTTGWVTASVGLGARTIEISPDGRYIFAACNAASKICVVDTHTMKQVLELPADSYSVGLAISDDGHFLISTSQGRKNFGGNCVDLFRIDYKEEPVVPARPASADSTATATTAQPTKTDGTPTASAFVTENKNFLLAGGASLLALCGLGGFYFSRKRSG